MTRLPLFIAVLALFGCLVLTRLAVAAVGCDSLCQLFGKLAQGEYKLLVAPGACGSGVSNFSCHSLGMECGNPAKNGTCWCKDFDGNPTIGGSICGAGSVATNGESWADIWYQGYPTDYALSNDDGYSAAGIRKADGMVMLRGGGHAIRYGGEASVHEFNSESAAANILAGGNGGDWSVIVAGPRLIGNSDGEPEWSQQNDRACSGTSPWVSTNYRGEQMTQSGHSYWGITPIPGTTKWLLGSFYFGCGVRGAQSAGNGAIEVDDQAKTTTLLGSYALGSPMFPGGGYDSIDGKIYSGSYLANDSTTLHAFNISSAASYGVTNTAVRCNGNDAYGRAIVFPDPSAPMTDRDFIEPNMYGYKGRAGSANGILLVEHLHGVRVVQCSNFIYGLPQYGVTGGAYAYDDDDGTFYWFNQLGGDLYHMVVDFRDLARTTITKVATTPIGDVPHCPNPDGSKLASIEYLPASRPNSGGKAGIIVSCRGLVWARAAPF